MSHHVNFCGVVGIMLCLHHVGVTVMTSGRFNCSSSEYSACVQTKHVALKSDKNVFFVFL